MATNLNSKDARMRTRTFLAYETRPVRPSPANPNQADYITRSWFTDGSYVDRRYTQDGFLVDVLEPYAAGS
jgi:hypothetical protein